VTIFDARRVIHLNVKTPLHLIKEVKITSKPNALLRSKENARRSFSKKQTET